MRLRSPYIGLLLLSIAASGCSTDAPTQPELPQDTVWRQLALSDVHACGLTEAGTPACWGSNESGQLGQTLEGPELCSAWGTTVGCSSVPIFTPEVQHLASVMVGGRYSCGLTPAGAGMCWGAGDPERVALLHAHSLLQLSGSSELLCGLDTDGAIACWKHDPYARPFDDPSPTMLTSDEPFTAVTAGQGHVCALGTSGTAYCWGENGAGQLGVGDFLRRDDPTPVAGQLRFIELSASRAHTCGRTGGGEVYCWGENRYAQLGVATPETCYADVYYPNYCPSSVPVKAVAGYGYRSVAAGWEHTCAIDADGRAVCWGTNRSGALGTSDVSDRCAAYKGNPSGTPCTVSAVAVDSEVRFFTVEAGMDFTCGITERKGAFCWGSNYLGKLGTPAVAAAADRSEIGSVKPVRIGNPDGSPAIAGR